MPMIHENLKLLRQVKGMTQADIADTIHVTRQTVSSYESGRTQPDLETLKRLAEAYQVDIQDILYGSNRLQRKMNALKYTIYGLIAVALLGILVHSILLWVMDAYFFIPRGTTITDSNSQKIALRFALRDIAQVVSSVCTTVFYIGSLILLYPISVLQYLPPLKKRVIWLLALIAAAHAIVLPWLILSGASYYGNYFLPAWNLIPALLLVFIVSQLAALLKKRKNR